MTNRAQAIRFALVGVASNAVLYVLYIGMTWVGVGHKLAMSLAYVVGVLQTFFLNRNWTFNHAGPEGFAFRRYCLAYGGGYFLQLGMLYVLVDHAGMDHRLVQGMAVCTVAFALFVLQKHWVFASRHPLSHADR